MSISIACHACGWKDTADDSVAEQEIACRACGAAILVPTAIDDERTPDYEVIEDERAKAAEAERQAAAKQAAKAAAARQRKKQKAAIGREPYLNEPPSWFTWGRILMIGGLTVLAAGVVTFLVDLLTSDFRVYSVILVGLGGLFATAGYVFHQAQTRG